MPGHFLSSGVTDEQEAVSRIKDFLVNIVEWEVAQDVTNTPSDRDVVFSSIGEADVLNGFTRYIRIRGHNNSIQLYTYETFNSVSDNTGEVTDAIYGLINTESDLQGFILSIVADRERAVIQVETYDDTVYQGYVGRIRSYYIAQQFNQPNLVKGGQDTIYDWYYSANPRNCFMLGKEGSVAHYHGIEPIDNSGLVSSQVSDRDGSMSLAAPVLIRDDPDNSLSELVGEPRGVYRGSNNILNKHSFVKIGVDIYVVFRTNGIPMVVGPVSDDSVPSLQTDFSS